MTLCGRDSFLPSCRLEMRNCWERSTWRLGTKMVKVDLKTLFYFFRLLSSFFGLIFAIILNTKTSMYSVALCWSCRKDITGRESSMCKGTVQWKGISVWGSVPEPVPVRDKIGKYILGPVKELGLYLESHIELVKTLKDWVGNFVF